MAKAREIPGLTATIGFREAAALSVGVRADELWEHAEGVLDVSDIERVHAMRVATRRLRAVLEVYAPCFAAAELAPVLRDVKALADALGARRDPDVQIDALERFAEAVEAADAPGIELYASRRRADRAAGNERLAAALDTAEAGDLRGRLETLAASALTGAAR